MTNQFITAARVRITLLSALTVIALVLIATPAGSRIAKLFKFDKQIDDNAQALLSQGRQTFRFDTFGDEAF